MVNVVDRYAEATDRTVFICDFSPPRGGDPQLLEPATRLDVDFISVAYNPGRSVRLTSAIAAHWIKASAGKNVVFTLATRDMNKLAVQSLLLGAQLLGLDNLIVVKGDEFSDKERPLVKKVGDFRPTELVRSIVEMNRGTDFKGLRLRRPTDFCIGASIDMGRDLVSETDLARRKVEAGADFFITQPTFGAASAREFLARYADRYGEELLRPVFFGVQVMAPESVVFSSLPQWVNTDVQKGRPGTDIALQVLDELTGAGYRAIYLVPPVLRGGRRDYDAAGAVLEAFRR